jgi:hypothetical protein
MRLQLLACGLSSGSIQSRDVGPVFAPVSIVCYSAHDIRFKLMGRLRDTLGEGRKQLLVKETMDLVALEISMMMKDNFRNLGFDPINDLSGEWFPDSDPLPAAKWRCRVVTWTR